jgi:ankyrin repeat protein
MTEPGLFAPYGDNNEFSLYKIMFLESREEDSWSVLTLLRGEGEEINEVKGKFSNLQNYFEQRRYTKEIKGNFQAANGVSHIERLTPSTPSIFLGLFLAASRVLFGRSLKPVWNTVTVTGDLRYNPASGEMTLAGVGDIDKKYRAVREYAAQYPEGKHLFVYVNSKLPVPEGISANTEVKCFSEGQSVFDIVDFVFEPYTPGFEIRNLDDTQRRLLNGINGGQRHRYIATADFEKILQKTFLGTWTGFFIQGEGESGKSALAEEIARFMVWSGRIYAPVWVRIQNDGRSPDTARKTADDYFNDFVWSLCKHLGVDSGDTGALVRAVSKEQYLLVFDNLETDNSRLNAMLSAIDRLMESFSKNKPFLLITSRNYPSGFSLPNNLAVIKPPELRRDAIALLVNILAEKKGCSDTLKAGKGTEEYRQFMTEMESRLRSSPGLIDPAVAMLRTKSVKEALAAFRNLKDAGLREKTISLYKDPFRELPKKVKTILFMILNCTEPDTPESRDELFYHYLKEHVVMKNNVVDDRDIDNALQMLLDYNFMYRTEADGETKYGIKTHCFLAFSFEPEFAGEPGHENLRDEIMQNNKWKLHIALRYDQSSVYLEPILDALKRENYRLTSFLFTAAEYTTSARVLDLLKDYLGGAVDMVDEDGETALMAASRNPTPNITAWFLENLSKEMLFKKDSNGLNALYHAALFNTEPKIAKLLVSDYGFDPYEKITEGDFRGFTPYSLALEANPSLDICKCLIDDLGCDVNRIEHIDVSRLYDPEFDEGLDGHPDAGNLKNFRRFVRNNQKELRNELTRAALIPIVCALNNPNIQIFHAVLSRGVDIATIERHLGIPFFHLAAKIKSNPEYLDMLKSYGCKVHGRDKFGFTALHHAAFFNSSLPIFNWLVENDIDINAVDNDGDTPFHIAARSNSNPEVIEWFFEQGADETMVDDLGCTAFERAVRENSSLQILKVFIDKGADIHAADDQGITPLHIAVSCNPNPEIYQWLALRGADINAPDCDGDTPLHLAVKAKTKDRIQWLLQHGADPGIKNRAGKKALP